MGKQILTLMSLVLILSLVSVNAIGIISGIDYTFQVDTTNTLYWDVVGNFSNMEGLNVIQDKYSNYSNITIVTHPLFMSDDFTIILFDREKEVVIKHHHSGGGCKYNLNYDWECSEWSSCDNNNQTRKCNKRNNCGNTYGKPIETRLCIDEPLEEDLQINTLGEELEDEEEDEDDERVIPLWIFILIGLLILMILFALNWVLKLKALNAKVEDSEFKGDF